MTATSPPVDRGGDGGGTPPAPISRTDLRLLERAVRHGWEIPEQTYRTLPLELLSIVAARDKNNPAQHIYKPRERIAAARVLAAMHAQNQKDQPAPPAVQLHAHEHRHVITVEERRSALLARLDRPGEP